MILLIQNANKEKEKKKLSEILFKSKLASLLSIKTNEDEIEQIFIKSEKNSKHPLVKCQF